MTIESELPKPSEEKITSIFGYDTLISVGDQIVEIKGRDKSIKLGEVRRLIDDENGYVGEGLKNGDLAEIIGFERPFDNNRSDRIVNVRVGEIEAWLKPSRIM